MLSRPLLSAKTKLLLGAACLLTCIFLPSSKPGHNPSSQVVLELKQIYLADVATLQQTSALLAEVLYSQARVTSSQAQLQELFYQVKQAYKRIEYLVEYLDPELAKNINGAPIPKVVVEQGAYQFLQQEPMVYRTFPPQGLQVLEELLFADEISSEQLQEATTLAYALQEQAGLLASSLQTQTLASRQLLESLREQILRLITMGITGFDAPAGGRELEWAATSLQPVLDAVKLYSFEPGTQAYSEAKQAIYYLEHALLYLEQSPDFDSFNRLHFIRAYADPAYASLTALQHSLLGQPGGFAVKPVSNTAFSLFSTDFLQSAFYAKQDQGMQNQALQELGKALFFDPVLSANGERACASCHIPSKAFTDGKARSTAFNFKEHVKRNAPSLVNSVFSTAYFWDGRSHYLQDQVSEVVLQPDEMHGSYKEAVQRIQESKEYRYLFKKAFPRPAEAKISTNTINRAIAAYVQSLVALNSPFDRYMRKETELLDAAAIRGFNLFMGKAACGTCHFAPVFNGTVPPKFLESEFEVLGVTASADFNTPVLDQDLGRGGIIASEAYMHSFKTPTVRNVALTGPYMHNGAFATLEEVIEFYDRGGGAGLGLDVPNQTLPGNKLHLSPAEKQDLIAFMHSLSDTTTIFTAPARLPAMPAEKWKNRPVGGRY